MWKFIIIFLCHGIFIVGILDILFKSTVYENLKVQYWKSNYTNKDVLWKWSKRVVLFSCDGLPAKYLFEITDGQSNAPFIRSLITNNGSWGLSFTRVPTESRPGHVALIAGLYEDPSAIFRGWKENPVSFDTVFNKSDLTIAWGAEDIVNIFEKRVKDSTLIAHKYPSDWQDFSGLRGTAEKLDNWVYEKFLEFRTMLKKPHNMNFLQKLKDSKLILFFHLCGMDLAGHSYKPKTEFYYRALRNVDSIVKNITTIIDELFEDDRTSFILTSDHGMTDWGSHGSSSEIETITPVVVWGHGLRGPQATNEIMRGSKNSRNPVLFTTNLSPTKMNGNFYSIPSDWNLDYFRFDINQADIAPLISSLLRTPVPVNSVGVLPYNFLNMPYGHISEVLYNNVLQLLEHYLAKENDVKCQLASFLFKPYSPLIIYERDAYLKKIEASMREENYHLAISLSKDFIEIILNGMDYYDYYFRVVLLSHIFLGFFFVHMAIIGEILYYCNPMDLESLFIYPMSPWFNRNKWKILMIGSFIFITLYLGNLAPARNIIYLFLVYILALWSIQSNPWFFSIFKVLNCFSNLLYILLYSFIVIMLASAFITDSSNLSMTLGIAALSAWPFLDRHLLPLPAFKKIEWATVCVLLAGYTRLPINANEEMILLKLLSSGVWLIIALLRKFKPRIIGIEEPSSPVITVLLFAAAITLLNTIGLSLYFSFGYGRVMIYQIISFIVLATLLSCSVPRKNTQYPTSFLNIVMSVGIIFILFSISYDSLFPLLLSVLLFLWVDFEKNIQKVQFSYLSFGDIRRSFLFVFLIIFSFFAIGNISSINSFNTAWIKSFITHFSPFIMMGLILLRSILPFFIITCAFKYIMHFVQIDSKHLFYLVLLICDSIAAVLLFFVKNTGSWLEIGSSLSRFIIMEVIVLFLLVLYYLVEYLIGLESSNNHLMRFNDSKKKDWNRLKQWRNY